MCGILGVITKTGITNAQEKYLIQGLYADALRGFHSTGIAGITKGNTVQVVKKAMNAYDFISHKSFDTFMTRSASHRAYIAHNRHATQGDINNNNAHPFTIGDITMVHNGSLRAKWRLPNGNDFTVDSEAICSSLSTHGPEETIKLLEGSFAIVWYNRAEQKIYMARNAERPMALGTLENGDVLFASEEGMMNWIAERNNINIVENYELDVGHILEFDLTGKRMDDWDTYEVELYKPAPIVPVTRRHNNYSSNQNNHGSRKSVFDKEEVEKTTGKYQGQIYLPSTNQRNNSVNESERSDDSNEGGKLRKKRQKKFLDMVGLNQGEVVEFSPLEFAPYYADDPNSTGVARGCMVDDPFCSIEVHGVKAEDMEIGSNYLSTLLSVRNLSKEICEVHTLSLLLNPTDIVPNFTDDSPDDGDDDEPFEKALEAKEDSESGDEFAQVDIPFRSEEDIRAKGEESMEFLYLLGPANIAIPVDEWDKLTRHGCCQCTGNLKREDNQHIKWINAQSPMCPECVKEWDNFSQGKGPLPDKTKVN